MKVDDSARSYKTFYSKNKYSMTVEIVSQFSLSLKARVEYTNSDKHTTISKYVITYSHSEL